MFEIKFQNTEDDKLRCELFDYIAKHGPQPISQLSKLLNLGGLETYDLLNHEWFERENPKNRGPEARYRNAVVK